MCVHVRTVHVHVLVHLYCNREEITVPLSIAKCYHHSKVLLCGYRYCYRHCLYRYCTGTVRVPALLWVQVLCCTGMFVWLPVILYMATSTASSYPPGTCTVTGNFMRWRPGNFMASSLVINRFSEHGNILVCAP